MEESLENLVHAGAFITWAACAVLGYAHRGGFSYDKERRMHVSVGNGLSAKIIKKFPSYRRIFSAVDHLLYRS